MNERLYTKKDIISWLYSIAQNTESDEDIDGYLAEACEEIITRIDELKNNKVDEWKESLNERL